MDKQRKRSRAVLLRFSEEEILFLHTKMREAGIKNREAYLRKMALDGYIIRKDYSELKSLINELNHIGNNLNQMTKVANTYGGDHIQLSELKAIEGGLKKIWQQLSSLE
ncbi:Bacterial mobilization protein [Caprobacter fermentans]|uniref:Bacterial mobilization protein n=1 Tax=Caproicibacter fermentans TaxID=2576756 RepID=A0A6N8HYJ0_9FIRM|nr:MobC family plasmid mobilization relaxosome protein [Caproicibacter fermentans]MVB10822.1 Bacterial mobilization protein [Caproicibacter fermentans]